MTRQSISILFFSLSLFSFSNNSAQTISSIEIKGNKNFTANDYLSWAKINRGSNIFEGIEDSLQNRILKALQNEGYYNSSIQTKLISIDSSYSKLILNITENDPTLIADIKFDYDKSDSIYISKIFPRLSNKVFNKINVEEAFDEILNYFENSGFPFASVRIESIYFYSDSISQKRYADLYLKINKGIKSKIDRIEIEGNTKTKDYVIIRAIGLNIGEDYNQSKIDEIPNRLNRLRFFEQVDVPTYYFNSKNEGILKIIVKEKEANNFDGIIGYIPNGINDKGYFTGFVNISLRNLFGTGRSAAIRWQKENKNTQELELKYLEPWIFNFPFNISGSLFQRIQDSTYVQRTLEGNLEYIASEEISASVIINTQGTIPIERKNKIFTVYNSSSFTTGINLKIDTRDDYYSPKEGMVLINTYKYTSKKIEGPKEFITKETKTFTNFQRIEIDLGIYKEIFNYQVGALEIHARELRGSDVEISDYYLLGGTKTLRGYLEKQFQGSRIFWSNFEYRYLLSKRSYAFLFLDSGYFFRTEKLEKNISKLDGFKIGYGFGLNIETSLGILGISFALAKGDSFSNGKIHFGIISDF